MSATAEQPKPQPELLDRLSDAVERLLRQGATFEEIKINDLVREGGLAKSTFYVYFDDKTALLSALAQRVMSDLVGFEAAWWQQNGPVSAAADHHGIRDCSGRHGRECLPPLCREGRSTATQTPDSDAREQS